MILTTINKTGEEGEHDFKPIDLKERKILYHTTPKERRVDIEKHGLLINQPNNLLDFKSGFLFFDFCDFASVASLSGTIDVDQFWADNILIRLNLELLIQDNFEFYEDSLYARTAAKYPESKQILIYRSIPSSCILKIHSN